MKLNRCAFDIFFKAIADIKKKKRFALVPRLAAYFFSDVFPLNLSSNNLYSEYILTICFGYNMEQYFPIIAEDISDRLAHFTRYASTF